MSFSDSLVICRVPVMTEDNFDGRGLISPAEKKRGLKRHAGFTLIELCIVIGVLGILASIAIFNFMGYRDKAKAAQAQADIDRIVKAIVMLNIDTGRWPGQQVPGLPAGAGNEVGDLNAVSAGLCAPSNNFPNWNGPYYSPCPIPQDPWGGNYIYDTDYTLPSGQKVAVVHSGGPNKSGINVYDNDNPLKIIR
jgi:type II secretion system protein G